MGELMPKLAPVELALNPMAEVGLLDLEEDVDRFEHAPPSGQRLGEPIGRCPIRVAFEHHIRRGRPMAKRGGDPL